MTNVAEKMKNLTILANMIILELSSTQENIKELESMLVIMGLPIFPDQIRGKDRHLKERLDQYKEKLEDILAAKHFLAAELPHFAEVYPIVDKYQDMLEVFSKAKAWSDEELEAMKTMDAYYRENHDILAYFEARLLDEYLKAKAELKK